MDLKLFDSVSLSGSTVFSISTSNSWRLRDSLSSLDGKSYPQLYTCKVAYSRASGSSVDKASISSGSTQSYLSWITTMNEGRSSSWFSKGSRLLDASDDEYDGVVVNPESLPSDPDTFASRLVASLSHWRMKGKKGVWLKLSMEHSVLVPIAVKEGFGYHHAEPGYVMLTYWIPEGPCMLPTNASHQVGIGGLVINEKNEVLVVQERYCAPAFAGFWKIPTCFIVEVVKANDCIGPEVEKLVASLHEGGVLLLENVRFYKEEEKNEPEFAKKLASLADLFVNDAFGTAHRAHASTEGVTKFLKPSVAGFLLQKIVLASAILDGWMGLDIGPDSIK